MYNLYHGVHASRKTDSDPCLILIIGNNITILFYWFKLLTRFYDILKKLKDMDYDNIIAFIYTCI